MGTAAAPEMPHTVLPVTVAAHCTLHIPFGEGAAMPAAPGNCFPTIHGCPQPLCAALMLPSAARNP